MPKRRLTIQKRRFFVSAEDGRNRDRDLEHGYTARKNFVLMRIRRRQAGSLRKEQEEIKDRGRATSKRSEMNFHQHEFFAPRCNHFQIAIAIAAISALTRKRASG